MGGFTDLHTTEPNAQMELEHVKAGPNLPTRLDGHCSIVQV